MTINEKIKKILEFSLKRWNGMTKEELIEELYFEFEEYLNREAEYENEDYIDSLLGDEDA